MSLPTVRSNNFVKSERKTYVDIVSKAFVYCELLLGVNRLPIISENRILVALFCVYSLVVNVLLCYLIFENSLANYILEIMKIARILQYEITAVLSLLMCKRFHRFYKEIEKFDCEVGCRPKISMTSIKLLVSFGIVTMITLYFLPLNRLCIMPLHLTTVCEYFYFGYLIDLIVTRMRLLNYYLECLTSIAKTDSSPKITEFQYFDDDSQQFCFPNMRMMMELYQIIFNVHKLLVDAVKWLVLEMVVISFIYTLVGSYTFTLLKEEENFNIFDYRVGVLVMSYLQLFPPCISSDRLQEEVCRFRELLSSSLYENQLDRSNRSSARKLLVLTESHNLSFSLLKVLDISISLPFSFIGLIITYLIIMLQFKKVLHF